MMEKNAKNSVSLNGRDNFHSKHILQIFRKETLHAFISHAETKSKFFDRRRDPENKRQNHFLSPNTDLFEPASCKKATKKSPKLREKSQTAVLPDTQKFIKD